jgi:hypothetical protein
VFAFSYPALWQGPNPQANSVLNLNHQTRETSVCSLNEFPNTVYEGKIHVCDEQIAREAANLTGRVDPTLKPLPARKAGRKASGPNGRPAGLVLLTEVGANVSRFKSEKHFCF